MATGISENFDAELAKISQQVNGMSQDILEIKDALKSFIPLDRTLAELTVHIANMQKETAVMWARIDTANKAAEDGNAKAEAITNKWKGAVSLGGIVFTVTQAVLGAIMWWGANTIIESSKIISVQEYRIKVLEGAVAKSAEYKGYTYEGSAH